MNDKAIPSAATVKLSDWTPEQRAKFPHLQVNTPEAIEQFEQNLHDLQAAKDQLNGTSPMP